MGIGKGDLIKTKETIMLHRISSCEYYECELTSMDSLDIRCKLKRKADTKCLTGNLDCPDYNKGLGYTLDEVKEHLSLQKEANMPEPKVDNWENRAANMRCQTCMYWAEKGFPIGRCRRHAPTMSGYPVVYCSDWCGDHKLNENVSESS